MRLLKALAIISIFISCQRKISNHQIDDLSYSIDTVIIDSKGRNIDLKSLLFTSDLNEEESSIFLYNGFDHSIDEVDLKYLEIVNNYPLETEGPDGIGEPVNNLTLLKNGSFFIKSFGESAIFNKNGTIIKQIDWVNSINTDGLVFGQIPRNEIAIQEKDLKVFGISYDNQNREIFMDILNVQDNSIERFDIDSEKSYKNFVLVNEDPKSYTFMDPYVYLLAENNLVIVSHQYSNEIFLFNSNGKYAKTIQYNPEMTPKRVEEVGSVSPDQLFREYQHFLEQVRFGPPVWDKNKNRYLRLSATRLFKDTKLDHSPMPEIKKIIVYLSIFDANFNLISEVIIPELNSEFVKYFVKDGRLWVSQNFNDELGFIVIDI